MNDRIIRIALQLFALVGLMLLIPAVSVCYKLNLLPPHIWWEAPAADIALGFGSMMAVYVYVLLLIIVRQLLQRQP